MTALIAARDAGLFAQYLFVTEAMTQALETYGGATRVWVESVHPGYGRHEHNGYCRTEGWNRCMKDCDDSDYIVNVRYLLPSGRSYLATYGVLDGVVTLWMD